jgi:hypothetical protein
VAFCAIAVATRPEGAPLTGLSWRATSSEADEATGVRPGMADPASGREIGNGADARRMSGTDQVSCCVRWPGVRRRAVKAEPALTPGRGGAQRSRLDLIRLNSATQCADKRRRQADRRITTGRGLSYGKRREPNRWPLRPEAKYRRGLPAPLHAQPPADRPWVSAGVHRCRWRLSLSSSLGRSRARRERLPSPALQVGHALHSRLE